ncbi:hypothetical protein B484DRAFT_441135 [Ochromonadaceae sp. CCMP2298]|nr:hypothetical protein B484DRAFT_441135 [Ochromonadaceae sp. CCMP2298]
MRIFTHKDRIVFWLLGWCTRGNVATLALSTVQHTQLLDYPTERFFRRSPQWIAEQDRAADFRVGTLSLPPSPPHSLSPSLALAPSSSPNSSFFTHLHFSPLRSLTSSTYPTPLPAPPSFLTPPSSRATTSFSHSPHQLCPSLSIVLAAPFPTPPTSIFTALSSFLLSHSALQLHPLHSPSSRAWSIAADSSQ